MAIISSFTIIRSLSIFHLTLAFYFLTNPRKIVDQNLVFLLGEAMQLPHVTDFNKPSAVTAFLAVVFAFLGVTDFTAVSLAEPLAVEYWSSMTPIRLLFLFPLTAYTYLYKPDGYMVTKSKHYKQSPGDHLNNGVIFSWAFMELVMWFWVYVTLKDQRRQAAMRVLEKRAAEAGRI